MGGGSRGWIRGRCLGRGSTATVYLAASTSGDRRSFAVKCTELSRSAPLQREEKILSSLCSPHVVSCFGSHVTAEPDGRVLFNLLLEYVPGVSVAEATRSHGGLDERVMRLYTRGILDGLAYLHSRGIVHCDVKGHNILVNEDERDVVKLADFGCARWVDGGDNGGLFGGTPLYMAPEVARGEEQGTAADIWALGCTVIEMATGGLPWPDVENPAAALHRIAFSTDVPEFPCNISDDARDFLGKCLNRDPRERWAARELQGHPFVKCCGEEFPAKRTSPKSTLDLGFWDSWQQEDDGEDEAMAKQRPRESARARLRQLVISSASPSPAACEMWDKCRWITVRNGVAGGSESSPPSEASSCERREIPIEEEEPSTSCSTSAGDGDGSRVTTEGRMPSNLCSVSSFNDACILGPCTMVLVDEGDDPVYDHSSPHKLHDD